MPIPSNKEVEICMKTENPKEMLDKLYREKYGWNKQMTIRAVTYNPTMGMPVLSVYDIDADVQGCSCQAKGKANYIKKEGNTAIQLTCANCRRTTALSFENMKKLDERFITIDEAFKILEEDNWMIPLELREMRRGRNNPVKLWW